MELAIYVVKRMVLAWVIVLTGVAIVALCRAFGHRDLVERRRDDDADDEAAVLAARARMDALFASGAPLFVVPDVREGKPGMVAPRSSYVERTLGPGRRDPAIGRDQARDERRALLTDAQQNRRRFLWQ